MCLCVYVLGCGVHCAFGGFYMWHTEISWVMISNDCNVNLITKEVAIFFATFSTFECCRCGYWCCMHSGFCFHWIFNFFGYMASMCLLNEPNKPSSHYHHHRKNFICKIMALRERDRESPEIPLYLLRERQRKKDRTNSLRQNYANRCEYFLI